MAEFIKGFYELILSIVRSIQDMIKQIRAEND